MGKVSTHNIIYVMFLVHFLKNIVMRECYVSNLFIFLCFIKKQVEFNRVNRNNSTLYVCQFILFIVGTKNIKYINTHRYLLNINT